MCVYISVDWGMEREREREVEVEVEESKGSERSEVNEVEEMRRWRPNPRIFIRYVP